MDSNQTGTIISIRGQVVEVEFPVRRPRAHDIIVLVDDPSIKMEVHSSSGTRAYFCLLLSSPLSLYRGAQVINTEKPIMIPAGKGLLGRVIDVFGDPLDGKPPIAEGDRFPIYRPTPA